MKKRLAFICIFIFRLPFTSLGQREQQIEISSFETRYVNYGRYHGRAHNIRHAVGIISSVTLRPNEQFSFNDTVGQRTRANGFRRAPVIIAGRIRRGYGGGVCQVASTIYASALYAGLTVVEQHPHTRISNYIRPGLDATVDWNRKDLVLQNSYPFPVTMVTSVRLGERVTEEYVKVTFKAPTRVPRVTIGFYQRAIEDFDTIEEYDPNLSPGQRRVVEAGTPRIYVIVNRTFESLTGFTERPRERKAMIYEASSRVIRFGPTVE